MMVGMDDSFLPFSVRPTVYAIVLVEDTPQRQMHALLGCLNNYSSSLFYEETYFIDIIVYAPF